MFIKKLFFPGEFYEAFIYMRKLLLFNEEGGFFFIDLERVARHLENTLSPEVKSFSTHLYARNDWLAGERFSSLLKNRSVRSTFLQVLDQFPNEISLGQEFIEHVTDINIPDLLDVSVYNRRLYLGTDKGLFHTDLELRTHEIKAEKGLEKRYDAPCIQVNVKYGAVTISCGDDGLFTHFDEFGVLNDQKLNRLTEWQQTQDKSLRTAWLWEDLVNYATSTEPVLLEVERSDKRIRDGAQARTGERVATAIRDKPTDLTNVFGKLETSDNHLPQSFLYVYNTSHTFFVQTRDRYLFSLPVRRSEPAEDQPIMATDPRAISQKPLSRILNATNVRRNTVLELYDSVQLLSGGILFKLVDGEALSVKSFPGSRRYQNLVTVITDEGVYVISLFDEREFRASQTGGV